jgi:MazG family protein
MSTIPQSPAAAKFERLTALMARLRAPDGCPWDRKQSFDSIKPYLLEETYEVLDAVDARDWAALREELGDLMLQAVFFAQMAREEGRFGIEDSLDAINEKLVRRHPHVFGDGTADTPEEVKRRWDEIKAEEKKELGRDAGLLATVPTSMPALVEASQIASRAAGVGFDWPDVQGVLDKLDEELAELAQARTSGAPAEEVEGELGDLLFVVVNLARFLKVDPEQALRRTNRKFRARFSHVEQGLKEAGKAPAQATLEEMETLWQEAKRKP